jgi:hypothetical protein
LFDEASGALDSLYVVEVAKPGAMTSWLPAELLGLARDASRGVFQGTCDAQYFLVIILDGKSDELRGGLSANEAGARDKIPFRTSPLVDHTAASQPDTPRTGFDCVQALVELRARRCFVARLAKRGSSGAFQSQITIGRARNNDVVLRHPGVSKFHASFLSDDGRLLLTDAGSQNHTLLNRARVERQMEVHPGDRVSFGSVEAVICDADSLWLALRR